MSVETQVKATSEEVVAKEVAAEKVINVDAETEKDVKDVKELNGDATEEVDEEKKTNGNDESEKKEENGAAEKQNGDKCDKPKTQENGEDKDEEEDEDEKDDDDDEDVEEIKVVNDGSGDNIKSSKRLSEVKEPTSPIKKAKMDEIPQEKVVA